MSQTLFCFVYTVFVVKKKFGFELWLACFCISMVNSLQNIFISSNRLENIFWAHIAKCTKECGTQGKLWTECDLSSKLRDVANIVCENIINETKIISL